MGKNSLFLNLLLIVFLFCSPVRAAEQKTGKQEICFAISAMLSPEKTFSYYQDFLEYLSKKFGKRVLLKQRRTYEEVNDLLASGTVDCAFICTGAYIHADQNLGLPVVAVPQVHGRETYHSYIIVAKDSPVKVFDDLQGKIFALTDDLSNTGALYPEYLIGKLGSTPENFYSYYFYTHSHDKSVEAVARGIADGAAVDSLVYDYLKDTGDPMVGKTRVILRSPPFGIPPVVVAPKTDVHLKKRFQEILLAMDKDPEGKKILAHLRIDRFVLPQKGLYDSVRAMENFLKDYKKKRMSSEPAK